jgi:hypothetical protein
MDGHILYYKKIFNGKETIGVLLGLTITSLNDPKYAMVVVIVFKTLKSLIIPHFF